MLSGGAILALAPDHLAPEETPAGWTLLAWNDLGMHCVDEDFSVFAILPPFNTLNAQLLDPSGQPIADTSGITLTYEATLDPDGSSTQTGRRSNFWDYAEALFGAQLEAGEGLAGSNLPGEANTPQPMHWVADHNWWEASGIPVLPINESGFRQAYPLFRLAARNTSGQLLAEAFVTAPVSAEMNCITCHGSSSGPEAKPAAGWVHEDEPGRDYRLNILRLHDELQADNPLYRAAIHLRGYNRSGLYATVTEDAQPLLCANCHASAALGAPGIAGVPAMTRAMHRAHASVTDPQSGLLLNASSHRSSCYQCHPGQDTQCLRGAMGMAVDASGGKTMSCQSCHGGMDTMAVSTRQGWLDEPNCQSCHTGTATDNAGEIRYTDALLADNSLRPPANPVFSTNPDTPVEGASLYRYSHGHGGIACSACHGSPHAIYPTSKRNDNIQALDLQGHVGTIGDCSVCHQNGIRTADGGPHGMHSIGDWWLSEHGEDIEDNAAGLTQCMACHGADLRGTALSEALGPREFNTEKFGLVSFWESQQIGCYDCHRGPDSDDRNRNRAPVVESQVIVTAANTTAIATLGISDAETASPSVRIVSPPQHGRLALSGNSIAYTPETGFTGTDLFTFSAFDGQKESNLGVCRLEVGPDAQLVDTDGDGRPDLLERAFGTQRDRPNAPANLSQTLRLMPDGTRQLRFICDLRFVPPDIVLSLETSLDMDTWSVAGDTVTITSDHRGRTLFEINLQEDEKPTFVRFSASSRL
jgi:hypothetical protein